MGNEVMETGPRVHDVVVHVCQDCIDLKGQECHVPECVFCFKGMDEAKWLLDKMLICPIINGERIILAGDAVEPEPATSPLAVEADKGCYCPECSDEQSKADAQAESAAQADGKMDFEQRARAMRLSESRGIDDETAHELVYLRDRKIELEKQLAAISTELATAQVVAWRPTTKTPSFDRPVVLVHGDPATFSTGSWSQLQHLSLPIAWIYEKDLIASALPGTLPGTKRAAQVVGERDVAEICPLMDWEQVALNGGPPCFYVETNTPDEQPRFCGRARRWQGHGVQTFHSYVSLEEFISAERRIRVASTSSSTDYQRGCADMQRECARIVKDAGLEWKDAAQARRSKIYSAYVIAAIDLEGRIRAASTSLDSAWREVESAPKDGTRILLEFEKAVSIGVRFDPPLGSGRWIGDDGFEFYNEPIGWQPLPPLPVQEESE